ncbi:MAG: DUF4886 domain-containing protein [Bacteroidaceae bacterium]|nr:DUF4886 domain-containing protein [Bacteroidaceae bacterium]
MTVQKAYKLLLLISLISFFSCEKEDIEITDSDIVSMIEKRKSVTPYFQNCSLPDSVDTLRILAIGNSYTDDGTAYIQEIMDGLDVNPNKFCVYSLVHSAATLKYWWAEMEGNAFCIPNRVAGNIKMDLGDSTLCSVIYQPWDVIVVQQYSGDAIYYDSFNPYLRQIIEFVRHYCSNPQVALAWQMVHSYKSGFAALYSDSMKRWRMLAFATAQMMVYDGIDIIIPTGTAIQNARNTALNNPSELTRDGTHLGYGVARYIVACAWVQTLMAHVFGIDIRRCKQLHPLKEYEKDENQTQNGFIKDSSQPVNEQNQSVCVECAYRACQSPFEIYE